MRLGLGCKTLDAGCTPDSDSDSVLGIANCELRKRALLEGRVMVGHMTGWLAGC